MMMKTLAAATLVVLTASEGCKLDNVDRAVITHIPMATTQECEEAASNLDPKIGLRAVCISLEGTQ